jgi:kynureninase
MRHHHQDPREMEGYEEVLQKLLESLPLEERFIGLGPEERVLALPDEALHALSEDYLRTLSPATQAVIRQRIGRPPEPTRGQTWHHGAMADAPLLAPAEIDALAARLRSHYARFLAPLGDDVLLTGHSHQAWPDVSREGHMAAWDDAARLIDDKWGRILGEILPAFQERVAARLGSSRPRDIAIAPNTHELVYRLASCFSPASTVLTTDAEFHSMHRQLARLAEDGLRVITVPTDPAGDFGERFLAAIETHRPDWAALSQVLFTDARVITALPSILAAMAASATPVLVDVYHAFNVTELNVDAWPGQVFVTGGGYKYAQTGEGACWMLLPGDAARFRPRQTGWFAHFAGLEARAAAVDYGPGGQRFFGATFDAAGIYRGLWVLRWMDEMGLTPAVLAAHARARTQRIIDAFDAHDLGRPDARAAGLRLATPRAPAERGGFVALASPRAADLGAALRGAGVHTDVRGPMLRLGPAPYTTCAEIDRAMDHLARIARGL